MKIGIVLSNPPAYSETFFVNKIKFLEDSGYEVFVFVDKFSSNRNEKYIEGYSQGNGFIEDLKRKFTVSLRLLNSPFKSMQLFHRNRKDGFSLRQNLISLFSSVHILAFELDWLQFGFATMVMNRENVARTIGAKMAVSIRGYDIAIYPLKFPNCYELLWRRIDKLHYISDDLLALAIGNGFDLNKSHMKITPAIDVEKFKYVEHNQNSHLKITTVGRLNWKKGLEYTIEALSYLKTAGIQFEYTIIGEGGDFERLKFAAYQFDIFENVKFIGKKRQDEIIDILKSTDIYIQYSIQEGFGNSVLEAQAMGCICIVSDAEGLGENVLNGLTGFVVNKRNPELLFEKIKEVIHLDGEAKLKMIENGVARLKREFNLELQKQKFIDFYQNENLHS